MTPFPLQRLHARLCPSPGPATHLQLQLERKAVALARSTASRPRSTRATPRTIAASRHGLQTQSAQRPRRRTCPTTRQSVPFLSLGSFSYSDDGDGSATFTARSPARIEKIFLCARRSRCFLTDCRWPFNPPFQTLSALKPRALHRPQPSGTATAPLSSTVVIGAGTGLLQVRHRCR